MLRRKVLQALHDILLGVLSRCVIGEADEGAAVLLMRLDRDDLEAVVLDIGKERAQLVE